MTNSPFLSRRTVLAGAAAAGASAALVACGSDGSDTGDQGGSSAVTIAASAVPVGGGAISSNVVVTQPTAGQYKAFSAVCTHQGCTVSSVQDSKINCACHQSSFSAADGSPISGPATRPLAAKTVTLNGDTLTVS